MMRKLVFILLILVTALPGGCVPAGETTVPSAATTVPSAATTVPSAASALPPATAVSPTAPAAAVPALGTATGVPPASLPRPTSTAPIPTPTPHPLFPFTIEGLRERTFPGGEISLLTVMEETAAFTRYYIAYPSGDLTITGTLNQPAGGGPFPVIILVHGYADRELYYPGLDTWQAADFFARRGYLVLAPDLRSWGESDTGLSLFHTGLVADVLHLIGALPSLPAADPARLGLWGHSMGGGIGTKILTVDGRLDAAVLYAPNSADDADLIARWGPGCLPGQSLEAGDPCNPGEVIPPGTSPEQIAVYLQAAGDAAFVQQVAPYYHLELIQAPVQIHSGDADGERLSHTPPEWAAKLADGLEAAGKEVEFYNYPGQGHYFTGESWMLMMRRAADFFDAHLVP